jgi:hypothetical protein
LADLFGDLQRPGFEPRGVEMPGVIVAIAERLDQTPALLDIGQGSCSLRNSISRLKPAVNRCVGVRHRRRSGLA